MPQVLVIDDDDNMRLIVCMMLRRCGYDVLDCDNAQTGFEILQDSQIQLVICDWVMPSVNGLDLCRKLRALPNHRYVYFILLTGLGEREDLLQGFEAGADDFLTKPPDAMLLRARLRVGERIMALEQRLKEQNEALSASRAELSSAYQRVQNDLSAAARIQRQQLPVDDALLAPYTAEWLFLPAEELSGDIFNFFTLDDDHVALYHLDVSGHGIPSALLSVSMSHMLRPDSDGLFKRPTLFQPDTLLTQLNRHLCALSHEVEHFATLFYGVLHRGHGQLRYALAGHPAPLLLHNDGTLETLQGGGLPVGLFSDTTYAAYEVHLPPAGRLALYSDGVTECRAPDGTLFGINRLTALATLAAESGSSLAHHIERQLRNWKKNRSFEDDVSVLALTAPLDLQPQRTQEGLMGLSLNLSSNPELATDLRAQLQTEAQKVGLDSTATFRLCCAVIEGFNNCCLHAYSGQRDLPIRLYWHTTTDFIEIIIEDEGQTMPEGNLETSEHAFQDETGGFVESGRGLGIIRQWSDEVLYTRVAFRNQLKMRFNCQLT